MDGYTPDQSGINSLGGFAYQIKVFAAYALSLEENMQAGFEAIEDVSVAKLRPETIDLNEDKLKSFITSVNGMKVIQVKRTSVTAADAEQILLNWILLEGSGFTICDYILFTDSSYNNKDIVFEISGEDLYKKVLETTKKKATISKVKVIYETDKLKFLEIYESIKSKYQFISIDSIDNYIDEKSKIIFKKAGVNRVIYYSRIQEFLKHITCKIMESINAKQPYRISFEEVMTCCEDICCRFTEQYIYPAYSEFKKLNKIDFADLKIAKSREYKQLLACKLPQKLIETNLLYGSYYQSMLYKYLELNKASRINDLEETAFENFENVKFRLQSEGRDTPIQRLNETKAQPNSYADSDQIKYGVGIYLTREEEVERQISWEDEENAEF